MMKFMAYQVIFKYQDFMGTGHPRFILRILRFFSIKYV